MRVHHTRRTRALGALALALAVTVTACGNDGSSDTSAQVSATEHNDADVTFATNMIQHHAQALAMVDLTMGRPLDPKVEQLAEAIRAAQGPEIEKMSDWLTDWDEAVPETMRDHGNAGHDQGDVGAAMEGMNSDLPGMMSPQAMTALQDASDAEFQTMWLEMMIEHHTGAVEIAETQQSEGRYKLSVDLASDIVQSQTAEIGRMENLLDP